MGLTCAVRVALISTAWHGTGAQHMSTDWHNSCSTNSMASKGWFSYRSAQILKFTQLWEHKQKDFMWVRLPIFDGLDYTSLFSFWTTPLLLKILVFVGLKLSSSSESSRDADWKEVIQLSLQFQKGMELRWGFDTNISSPSLCQRAQSWKNPQVRWVWVLAGLECGQ